MLTPATAIGLSGCASHPTPAAAGAPGNPVQSTSGAEGSIQPVRLYTSGPLNANFAAADKDGPTLRIEFVTEPDPAAAGQWRHAERREYRSDRAGDARTLAGVDKLTRLGDGSISMAKQTNHAESVEVVFEPGLVVLPAALNPDTPFEQSITMTVHPIGDPGRVRARGRVRQTVTFAGRDAINTPAGQFNAARVLSLFEADLGATSVKNRTEQWLAEGAGLVAERRSERTTVLGVVIRSKDEFWLLKGADPGR